MTKRVLFLAISLCTIIACTHFSKDNQPAYQNNHVVHADKNFFDYLSMRFFSDTPWPKDYAAQAQSIPQRPLDPRQLTHPNPNQLIITWIGHSSFLIQYQGRTLLTDPIFSDRASPFSFAGPQRYTAPAIKLAQLPPIDAVIISHNHYDHLDQHTIEELPKNIHYFVPTGLKTWFTERNINSQNVTELAWWHKKSLSLENELLTVTAAPAQHWSSRSLWDTNTSHWASWHIQINDQSIWFAGDTGYNDKDFKAIGDTFTAIDVALIPIGAYAPRDFMKRYHVNVEEAIKIHQDIKAQRSIGMHWGTFPLTAEPVMEPKEKLDAFASQGVISEQEFFTLAIGERVIIHNP